MEEQFGHLYPQHLINWLYPYDTMIKLEFYPSLLN